MILIENTDRQYKASDFNEVLRDWLQLREWKRMMNDKAAQTEWPKPKVSDTLNNFCTSSARKALLLSDHVVVGGD